MSFNVTRSFLFLFFFFLFFFLTASANVDSPCIVASFIDDDVGLRETMIWGLFECFFSLPSHKLLLVFDCAFCLRLALSLLCSAFRCMSNDSFSSIKFNNRILSGWLSMLEATITRECYRSELLISIRWTESFR